MQSGFFSAAMTLMKLFTFRGIWHWQKKREQFIEKKSLGLRVKPFVFSILSSNLSQNIFRGTHQSFHIAEKLTKMIGVPGTW